jgi:pyridoxamine 5'-phosphate oxidase
MDLAAVLAALSQRQFITGIIGEFMAIADLRQDYRAGKLERTDLHPDPLRQFQSWFDQAATPRSGARLRKIGIALYHLWHALWGRSPVDVNAMTLATVDAAGRPSARTVLLKGVDARGFIFFTNYESRKGRELAGNPNAALVFFFPDLERQICIAGNVAKISREESEAYFKSRPRGSRIGAWASNQSSVVADRSVLEKQWDEIVARFEGKDVPIPPQWGGYVLSPTRLEFWQGRPSRLHDRFSYRQDEKGQWVIERLSP